MESVAAEPHPPTEARVTYRPLVHGGEEIETRLEGDRDAFNYGTNGSFVFSSMFEREGGDAIRHTSRSR